MNGIKPINLNNVYGYTQSTSAPSFKSAQPLPVQNQTQICSKEANKAVCDKIRVLVEMNAKEHFLNKKHTLPEVQKNLVSLYELSGFIESTPALKSCGMNFDDICEEYFEGIKYGHNAVVNVQEQKESLKKLADLGSNPNTAELYKKISGNVITDIIFAQCDVVGAFDEKTLDCYNRLLNDEQCRPLFEKINGAMIEHSLLQGEDVELINKNISELKKILQKPEYAFVKEINRDFDILKYKGDINKFFAVLKSYNDKLQEGEKLRFVIDPELNEAVITVQEEINKNFILKEANIYDINLKKISSDLTLFKGEEDKQFVQYVRGRDFRNNTNYELRRTLDDSKDAADWVVDTLVKEYRDDKGKIVKREIIKQSGIDGVFNVKTLDADGKIVTTSKAFKNPDGSIYIEKNLKNPDGLTTRIRYKNRLEKGVQDAEIMDYTIFDKNGKEVAKRENILQKINEFSNFSLKDGEKHRIYFDKQNINVVNEKTGKVTFIKLDELIREGDKDLKQFLKTLSGDILETINDTVNSIVKSEPMESLCIPETKYLEVGTDRFALHHEAGHIKSFSQGSLAKTGRAGLSSSLINGNKGRLSNDPELVKIFAEEKRRYVSSIPRRLRSLTNYYNDSTHLKAFGGLDEVFADVEAVLNEAKVPKSIMSRVHLLMENYPKTIAYIMKRKL